MSISVPASSRAVWRGGRRRRVRLPTAQAASNTTSSAPPSATSSWSGQPSTSSEQPQSHATASSSASVAARASASAVPAGSEQIRRATSTASRWQRGRTNSAPRVEQRRCPEQVLGRVDVEERLLVRPFEDRRAKRQNRLPDGHVVGEILQAGQRG